jgi:urease accessory protein UreE
VLGGMLEHLGLRVEACELPFFPERGAYEAHADDGHQH